MSHNSSFIEDILNGFAPFRTKMVHVIGVICVAICAIVASIVIPSVRASAAPTGVSAQILNPSCGSDASFNLVNHAKQSVRFDIWQHGLKDPIVSVNLIAGISSTLHAQLPDVSDQYVVRVNGQALASTTVNRMESCADQSSVLPAVVKGVSAKVTPPACGATTLFQLNNGSTNSTQFTVVRGSAQSADESITPHPNTVVSATIDADSPVDLFRVRSNNKTLVDATVNTQPACAAGTSADGTSTDNSSQAEGVWGTPVRVDNFNTDKLDTSSTGWSLYDSPNASTPRTKTADRVGVSDGDSGEARVVGTYDKTTGVHIGGGISDTFNQKYGRWEVRARSDKGAGFAPTILLWPQSAHWPQDGEIDLLESPKGDRMHAISVLHNGAANHFITHGLDGDQSQWHTYTVDWLPSGVTFYLDGVEQWTITDKSYIPTTSAMHMVIQNDAGCGWVQCPNAQTPAETTMHIDYVKVYAAPQSLLR